MGTVNMKWIADFVKTPMFARLSQAASHGLLHRKTAIDYNIGLSEIYKDESIDESERMMLVGIVDVFFEDQDGDLVLLDYKTDYVNKDRYEDIVARYKPQLDLYARALEDISGKRVKEKYISPATRTRSTLFSSTRSIKLSQNLTCSSCLSWPSRVLPRCQSDV